jgi:hypothetical protein
LLTPWFRPDLHPARHLLIGEEGYHVTSDLSMLLYQGLF